MKQGINIKRSYTLNSWSVVGCSGTDKYTAPELALKCMAGIRDDGKSVTTSNIISCNGPVIETRNSVYLLVGEPDPVWVEWCKQNGIEAKPPTINGA